MTKEDKNFNKWLKEYNPEQVKVFEETDLKIAYLQGCADEVEKWENVNAGLRKQLEQAKKIVKEFTEFVNNEIEYDPEHPQEHTDLWNELCEQAEQFLKEIKENGI